MSAIDRRLEKLEEKHAPAVPPLMWRRVIADSQAEADQISTEWNAGEAAKSRSRASRRPHHARDCFPQGATIGERRNDAMTRNIETRLDNLESMLAPTQRTRMVWANSRAEAEHLAATADTDPATRTLVVHWKFKDEEPDEH